MKNLFTLVILILTLTYAKATHLVSFDVTYTTTVLSNGDVQVDVLGALLANTGQGTAGVPLTYSFQYATLGAGCNNLSFIMTQDSSSTEPPINRDCVRYISNSTIDLEIFYYSGSFTLNQQACKNGVIYYGTCCRPGFLTNGFANNGFYCGVELKLGAFPANTTNASPRPEKSKIWNEYYVGGNASSLFPIEDPDGDSLFVESIFTKSNVTLSTHNPIDLNFLGGFSLSKPLDIVGNYLVNPKTGQFSFVPDSEQRAILSFRISEYRYVPSLSRHSLIGTSYLDSYVHVYQNPADTAVKATPLTNFVRYDSLSIPYYQLQCGDSTLEMKFDNLINFFSITNDFTEFRITSLKTNNSVPIKNIANANTNSSLTNSISIELFFPLLANDSLLLTIAGGSDGDTIANVCGTNAIADTASKILITVSGCPNANLDERTNHTFQLYPNPAKTALHISFKTPGKKHMEVFNLAGIQVNSFTEVLNGTNYIMSLSNLPTGMYMLRVIDEAGVIHSKRFVKE